MKISVLLLFFAAFVCLSHSEEDLNKQTKSDVHSEKTEGDKKFVATNEWQTIPEGKHKQIILIAIILITTWLFIYFSRTRNTERPSCKN